jgi:hypothetical protein
MNSNTREEKPFDKPSKTPRDKFKSSGKRGVLVNLDLDVAERFYAFARANGTSPTKLARGLIEGFLKDNYSAQG